jgi:hypothetical protein
MSVSEDEGQAVSMDQYLDSMMVFRIHGPDDVAGSMFLREIHGRGLKHLGHARVLPKGWSLDVLGDFRKLIERTHGGDDDEQGKSWLLRHDDGDLSLVSIRDGWAIVESASDDYALAHRRTDEIAAELRAPDDDASVTPITFWALNPVPWPQSMSRKLRTPSWEEISGNYSDSVRAGMEQLFDVKDTPDERMILWHGPSGTGKTFALRALARAWRDWCDVSFIADPESILGRSPAYLMEVATFGAGRTDEEAARRSKLIVLEDSGELMSADARRESGQGLSRLLNLTDGFIGQGLRAMVLITTNEPITSMHPAVVRPGRCLSQIEFTEPSPEQANRWLTEHNVDAVADTPTPLARLYALKNQSDPLRSFTAD